MGKTIIDRPLLSERLNSAYDYLLSIGAVHSVTDFAEALGKERANIANALACRGRVMTMGLLERVADVYSDILNRDWLLTGEGEMKVPDKNLRPHYDAKASAGFMDGVNEGRMSAEFRAMAIPLLRYDFSIDASGDSMMPRIESGDTLLCRIADDRLNPPIGKICVIDSKEGFVVKEIVKADDETLTLHSLNPEYRDYTIELSDILGIAEVVGLTRTF